MIAVDLDTNTATCSGQSVRVTCQQAVILHVLASGELVTRDDMIQAVHGVNEPGDALDVIRVQICKLRHKLLPLGLAIDGRYGVGYRLHEISEPDPEIEGTGAVVVHPVLNCARIGDQRVHLPPVQARILRHLVCRPRGADNRSLMHQAWASCFRAAPTVPEYALWAQISLLRKRLAPHGVAVRSRAGGGGYVLEVAS